MGEAAGWIAPIATMIAAMMTAANLGARVTGWGFIVFTIGSIAWTTVGVTTGQTNLITANGFLFIVNLFGVWRWLGREAKYQDSAAAVAEQTAASESATLAPASGLIGAPLTSGDGQTIATVVDVLIAHETFTIDGLMVRHGGVAGVGERIVLVRADDLSLRDGAVETRLAEHDLADLPLASEAAEALA